MPAPRTREVEIEHRRCEVARLYKRRYTYRQIATVLGCSHTTVQDDINFLLREWREDRKRFIDEANVLILQELSEVKREAWDGFERSKQDAQEIIEEKGTTDKGKFERSRSCLKGQSGDPDWLGVILKATDKEAKLLGLDAPTKFEDITRKTPVEVIIKSKEEALSFQQFVRDHGRISAN